MVPQGWDEPLASTVAPATAPDVERGLELEEASARLARHGPNGLPAEKGSGWLSILLRQFKSPFVYVLFGAALLSLYLGEDLEAVVIFIILAANAIIGFAQEHRAERSLQALAKLTASTCRVRRGGATLTIPSREAVPGDLLELEAGDRVPADAEVLRSASLQCDESILTGESFAAEKRPASEITDLTRDRDESLLYAGTIVVGGRGRASVTATGIDTRLGRLVKQSREAAEELPLLRDLAKLSRTLVALVVGFLALLIAAAVHSGASPANVLLTVISIAVAAIPEGLPIAMVVGLSIGVWRMARVKVLARRVPAVEALGAVTFICTDKTGTLTRGEMEVARAFLGGREYWTADLAGRRGLEADGGEEETVAGFPLEFDGGDPLELGLGTAAICCEADTSLDALAAAKNPTESALLAAAESAGLDWRALHEGAVRLGENPFSSTTKVMAVHVRLADGRRLVAAKGAPERVIAMCSRVLLPDGIQILDHEVREAFERRLDELGAEGLRVIALACDPEPEEGELEDGLEDLHGRLLLLGIVGLRDPPREGVREAVARCHGAGIEVAMLTGDSAPTAGSIAREVGILDEAKHPVITGPEIERMDDATLEANVAGARVFARVAPEHKLRIVKALQKRGHVVAMTGDGVNDMPALRAADVGVAMGKRGTEAAKEAGDVILADDDFRTIVDGVEEGRRIRDNLDRVLFFLLSASFGEMLFLGLGFLLLLEAFGDARAPLEPVQILWMNLATGALIAVPLMMERAEPGSMSRAPRRPKDGLLSAHVFIRVLLAGFCIALAASVAFLVFHLSGDPARATTLAFATMMVAEWFVALAARSLERPSLSIGLGGNRWLLAAIGMGVILALAVIQVPLLQPVFGTVALSPAEWGLVLALGSTPFWALECYKALAPRLSRRGNAEPVP